MKVSVPDKVLQISDAPPFKLPVLEFTKVDDYTTFNAEYAIDDQDLVFHFFVPESQQRNPSYWANTFPIALEAAAMETFKEGGPRVQASYIEDFELNSWWLKAKGFASVPDPQALITRFLDSLDSKLDPS